MITSLDAASELLKLLPEDGTPRPNGELRQSLNLSEAEYWRVRDELLEKGLVTKSQGRGGRTALVVQDEHPNVVSSSRRAGVLVWMVFGFAAVLFIVAGVYSIAAWGSERLLWDVLTLVFGSITVAGVGVALLIYRFQETAATSEAQGQARILKRLVGLTHQAVTSSADSRALLRTMQPAIDADKATRFVPPADAGEAEPEDVLEDRPDNLVVKTEHGAYYHPSVVPLQVISDLVAWWEDKDERGRWTISNLIGGYRAFNVSGNFVAMPWILTFESEDGQIRSFRVRRNGRQSGPAVAELAENGVWRDFNTATTA